MFREQSKRIINQLQLYPLISSSCYKLLPGSEIHFWNPTKGIVRNIPPSLFLPFHHTPGGKQVYSLAFRIHTHQDLTAHEHLAAQAPPPALLLSWCSSDCLPKKQMP